VSATELDPRRAIRKLNLVGCRSSVTGCCASSEAQASGVVETPLSPSRGTRSIRICWAGWRSRGPFTYGALSRSPSSNAGRWLLSETNSMRNTRPRLASMHSRQRIAPSQKYPATLGFDRSQVLICNSSPMLFYQIRWPSYAKDFSGCGLAARWDHRRSIPGPPIRPASNRRRT
jgi:hypothetical protein